MITKQVFFDDKFSETENLFDEEYAVSWHPAGKRPGKPQTVLAGIRASFQNAKEEYNMTRHIRDLTTSENLLVVSARF